MSSAAFRGVIVTAEEVQWALAQFDAQYHNIDAYDGWLEKGNSRYALCVGGRLYPPKYILSVVTGIPTNDFSGDENTSQMFRQLGFEVIESSLPGQSIRAEAVSQTAVGQELGTPIDSLELPVVVRDAFRDSDISTVEQLGRLSTEEVLRSCGFGLGYLFDVKLALKAHFSASIGTLAPLTNGIKILGLSTRINNRLVRSGIQTLEQFLQMSDDELFLVHGCSDDTIYRIHQGLYVYFKSFCDGSHKSIAFLNLSENTSHLLDDAKVNTIEQLLAVVTTASHPIFALSMTLEAEVRSKLTEYLLGQPRSPISDPRQAFETVAATDLHPETQEPAFTSSPSSLQEEATVPFEPDGQVVPLSALDLSVRAHNALARANINTVGQLAHMSSNEILETRNLGHQSVSEIMEKLQAYLAEHSLRPLEKPLEKPVEASPTSNEVPKIHLEPDGQLTPLEVLNLTIRPHNALVRSTIITVGQLAQMSSTDILEVRNLGQQSLSEITEKLQMYLAEHPLKPLPNAWTAVTDTKFKTDETQFYSEPDGQLTPLKTLNLSEQARSALAQRNVNTVGQLTRMSPYAILEIGQEAAYEITDKLQAYLHEHPLQPLVTEMLGRIDVARLGLYPAVVDRLHDQGIQTLGHLLQSICIYDPRRKVSNYVIDRTKRYLDWLSQQNVDVYEQEIVGRGISPLHRLDLTGTESMVKDWLADLPDRQRTVLLLRFGLHGGPLTLEQTGQHLKLTRERIRQLEFKALTSLKGMASLQKMWPLVEAIKDVIEKNGGALTVSQLRERLHEDYGVNSGSEQEFVVPSEFPGNMAGEWEEVERTGLTALLATGKFPENMASEWGEVERTGLTAPLETGRSPKTMARQSEEYGFDLMNTRLIGVLLLLAEVYDPYVYLKERRLVLSKSLRVGDYLAIEAAFVGILELQTAFISEESLLLALESTELFEQIQNGLSDRIMLACLHSSTVIQQDGSGRYGLRTRAWRQRALTAEALRQIGEPAHFSKIAERVSTLLGDGDLTAHSIHAYMERYPDIFVRVGHGIFGLAEWGLYGDGNLANAAYRVLRESGQPLHLDMLTEEVLKTWQVKPGSIYMAVENDERFSRIGPGLYWLREQIGDPTEDLPQANFGDVFGAKLARWQDVLNRRQQGIQYDTHSEVDALRSIGLDFFKD